MKKIALPLLLSIAMCLPTFAQITFTDLTTYTQNFNGIGGASEDPSGDTKKGVAKESSLPTGWKIEKNTTGPRTLGTYEGAASVTMYIGGQSLADNSYNGTWNFGATGSDDRAIGGLTTGIDNGTRGINVMAQLHNSTGAAIKSITLSYDIEKYRKGTRSFTVQLYTSADGETWTSAGNTFCTNYSDDTEVKGEEVVPINTQTVEGSFNVAFPANGDLYLAWNISVTSGDQCNNAQGFAIDNVSITPDTRSIPPTYAVFISDNSPIRENFDCLGGSDVVVPGPSEGEGKTGVEQASSLPTGWKVEGKTTRPEEFSSYDEILETTTYVGGTNLSSTAYNGTWNFGETGSTDRAVGGLTSGNVGDAARARCINVMVRLYNDSRADIEALILSYDIEKYRNCNNSNGFTVQVYTSSTGESDSWTSAGEDFQTLYAASGNVNAVNPAETTSIRNKKLSVNFPAETALYIAWKIAVSSGTNCAYAPALAIDNVSITPAPSARTTADGWASFASGLALNIPDGVTAYQAEYTVDGATETLALTELTNGVIPANTGVLLNGTNSAVLRFTEATDAAAIEAAEAEVSGNDLKASVERTDLDGDYDYFCMRYSTEIGTFFQLYQGAYVPAGKAYLKMAKEGGGSAPERQMRFVIKPNAPTAVENMNDDQIQWIKVVRDGQLLIIRGEETYTIYGARVR